MAKIGQRNTDVDHKTKGGCIWSMISLLDFRGGLSAQRKHGGQRLALGSSFREQPPRNHLTEKDGALDNEDEDRHQMSKSIRMLIDEEISEVEKVVQMSCTENKQETSEYLHNMCSDMILKEVSVYESCQSQPKDTTETLTNNLNLVAMHNIEDSHKQEGIKAVSGNSIDLSVPKTSDNVAVIYNLQNLETRMDGNQCILQQSLNDMLELYLHDKILGIKRMSYESERQKLMSALDLLNSDRNLYLKLLRDNFSNLTQHIQDLQNGYTNNILTPESYKLLDYKLLGDETNGLKECDKTVNKKTVMQEEARHSNIGDCHSMSGSTAGTQPPTSRTESLYAASTSNSLRRFNYSLRKHRKNEQAFFLFPFREIKRMVRNLLSPIKEKQHLVPLGVLPKNWYSFLLNNECKRTRNNGIESHLANGFTYNMRKAINDVAPVEIVNKPYEHIGTIELDFHSEAKRHLEEKLKCKGETIHAQEKRETQASSSNHKPRRDKELAPFTMQWKLASMDQQTDLNKCSLQEHGEENPSCTTSDLDDRDNIHDANIIQGFMNVNRISVHIESNSNQSTDIIEICEGETHQNSGHDSPKVDLDLQILWAPEINKSGDSDILIEKIDRLGPVSVLEQAFLDDIRCKESTTFEKSNQEPQLEEHIEELDESSKLSYLRSLLEASGLLHRDDWSSVYRRLLDDELFLEVEPPSGGTLADLSLYFDRINEVLHEIQADCPHIKSWLGFVKPKNRPMPVGEDLVQELWRKAGSRGVYGDLRTLGEIIGADLRTQSGWLEIGEGVDELGVVVGDEILEEILGEMVEMMLVGEV